ncbi:sulfotransferase domain-containing protein [Candidatus Pelagibacter sp.]|nr:sulfotransferase domain-containing protein [Candidatus Pelagibacter sp.]
MIIWIASYPKSGNTWLRALISSYFYSEDGIYNEDLLKKIDQFPVRKYFEHFNYDKKKPGDTTQFWIKAQEQINKDKKLKFFKTHNIFGKVNSFDFTNSENSAGAIYIVRDPRNVISSIKNHYGLEGESAIRWMTDQNNYIYDVERVKDVGYGDFTFISSWDLNYKSWQVQNRIPVKFIKYEDFLYKTYLMFTEIIEFIYKITNNPAKVDKIKLKNALNSTTFKKLQDREKKYGFSEAVSFTNSKKSQFFNLGPENDWKKILNEKFKNKINHSFEKNLKELSYTL